MESSARPRALLSVYDKTGIIEFAKGLDSLGYELVSTGGTARKLREAGLSVIGVSDVTGHPEIFDGRVKSLHPCLLYTSPSPRDKRQSRMPSSA